MPPKPKKPKKQNRGQQRRSQRSRGRGRGLGIAGPAGVAPGQPFPRSTDPRIGVVTARPKDRSQFIQSPQPDITRAIPARTSLIQGGTPSERRAIRVAESALAPSRRRAERVKTERFCEIKIVKGKRKRVCKTKTKITKKKKAKVKRRRPITFSDFLRG